MIILPPKEIEDKIKFIHNDVVAIKKRMKTGLKDRKSPSW